MTRARFSRDALGHALSLAALTLTALVTSSCITTEGSGRPPPDALLERGPDPRAALPTPRGSRLEGATVAGPEGGMRVISLPSASDPIVSVRVMFLSGSRDDPAGKEGLTRLSAELMAEATEKLSSGALREALFPWAAELSVQSDKETTVFLGRVHEDHADAFVPLFLDVILAPRLDPADFARKKSEALSFLRHELRQGDDELLQREALEVAIFDSPMAAPAVTPLPAAPGHMAGPGTKLVPRHPYRHTPTGTVLGLESITLDDVKAHLRRVFTQDRLLLGVAGGANTNLVRALTTGLAKLPATSARRPSLPVVSAPLTNQALVIDKKTPGSAISVGYQLALDRTHPDYAALKVAEAFFGEHRNRISWLFQVMREQRGLNYGDYAYIEHFVQDGWSKDELLNIGRRQQYFSLWIRPVEHKNRHFALRQAVYELDRFVTRGIPDDESFERLIAFLPGHWQQKEQEPMRRLGYALDDAFYGVAWDRDDLRAQIAKLTRAEVNAAIKRHLRADRLHIVVVTEGGDAFAKELIEGAPSPITYAAEKPAALLKEDETISSFDLRLDDGSVRVVRPEQLFQR